MVFEIVGFSSCTRLIFNIGICLCQIAGEVYNSPFDVSCIVCYLWSIRFNSIFQKVVCGFIAISTTGKVFVKCNTILLSENSFISYA